MMRVCEEYSWYNFEQDLMGIVERNMGKAYAYNLFEDGDTGVLQFHVFWTKEDYENRENYSVYEDVSLRRLWEVESKFPVYNIHMVAQVPVIWVVYEVSL